VAEQSFAERGRRGVVFDDDPRAESPRELVGDAHVLEAGHVGQPPAASIGVDLAGDRHAHLLGSPPELEHGARDRIEHGLGTELDRRVTRRRLEYAPRVDARGLDTGAPEVDADHRPDHNHLPESASRGVLQGERSG
jgi:hypothetical protein